VNVGTIRGRSPLFFLSAPRQGDRGDRYDADRRRGWGGAVVVCAGRGRAAYMGKDGSVSVKEGKQCPKMYR
jgi:hypothetical protein